jgi:DNA gyrase subunit A
VQDNDLMIISTGGVVIRMDVHNIIRGGRATQGRRMMNLGNGDMVVAVATTNGKKLDTSEESEDAPEGALNDGSEEEVPVEEQAIEE